MVLKIPAANADIISTVRRQYIKPACICIGWTVLICALELAYMHKYFSDRMNPSTSIVIWIALCSIPFIKLKVPQLMLDRGWCGTLMELSYERVLKASTAHRKLSYTHVAQLVLRNGDRMILYKLPMDSPSARLHYRIGDKLCRFAGTRYPVYAEEPENGTQICPICGARLEPDVESCFFCHHSRIKLSALSDN